MILRLFQHEAGLRWCMEQLDFVITVVMFSNFDAIFHQVGSSDIITSSQILTVF